MAAGPALNVSAHWWEAFQHRTTTTGRTSRNETVIYDSLATSCCWYIHLGNSGWFLGSAQSCCAQKDNHPNALKACVWAGRSPRLCLPMHVLGQDSSGHPRGWYLLWVVSPVWRYLCMAHHSSFYSVPLNPQSRAVPAPCTPRAKPIWGPAPLWEAAEDNKVNLSEAPGFPCKGVSGSDFYSS